MSKIEKVKKFVKENKKAIIVGTICTAVGACCGMTLHKMRGRGLMIRVFGPEATDAILKSDSVTSSVVNYNNMRFDNGWDECIEKMKELKDITELTGDYDPTAIMVYVKKK